MSKVTITGYTIMLRKSGRSKDFRILRQFGEKNNDLYNILFDFLNDRIGNSKIENVGDDKTIFYDGINKHAINTDTDSDCIDFTAKIGGYGISYPILDHVNGELKYTRSTDDTDAFPLEFTVYMPGINDTHPGTGFLISEKYKNKAAKGLFETHFKQYFSKNYPGYIIEIEPIIPEEFFSFFKKGKISKTTIKSYSIPKNIEDRFTSGENTKSKASVELVMKNQDLKKSIKNLISETLKEKKHVVLHELFTGYLIEPEEVSFTGILDGKKTTVILKEEGETMVPAIDVTKQVMLSGNGFPDKQRMINVEIRYLNDLIAKFK